MVCSSMGRLRPQASHTQATDSVKAADHPISYSGPEVPFCEVTAVGSPTKLTICTLIYYLGEGAR